MNDKNVYMEITKDGKWVLKDSHRRIIGGWICNTSEELIEVLLCNDDCINPEEKLSYWNDLVKKAKANRRVVKDEL